MMRYVIIIFFSASLAGALTFWNAEHERGTVSDGISRGIDTISTSELSEQISIFGKAAYVLDVHSGEVLYQKNPETQFPLASIAKTMSALVAYDLGPNAEIVITPDVLSAEGDSGLSGGEKWRRSDLSDFTLITSSNDGAKALASVFAVSAHESEDREAQSFVDLMNEKARAIGLVQTFFLNETGLDEGKGISGAYGSAKDITTLFSYIIRTHPDLLSATAYDRAIITSSVGQHSATNTNIITAKIPGLIASKTGFTDLAGGNLAVAFEAGPLRPIIIVVLGSTEEGRFDDVATLVDVAIAAVAGAN